MRTIDSHQHFWRYQAEEYGWITPDKAVLRRDFMPEDLQPMLGPSDVTGTIAVQARQTPEETAWLLELASQHAFIRGVVGWVDLCGPALGAQLERFGRHPKLVGVRHVVHDEPDDAFMLRPDFRAGIAQLAAYDLTYDLLLFPKHLPVATQLARRFLQQRFVLDHIAKPDIRGRAMEPWATDLRALAACPNVFCKLSGLVTEAEWQRWSAGDFTAYLDVVITAFGPRRLMVGSDWPVCTLAGSYAATMDLVARHLAKFPPADQQRILGDNCADFYRLEAESA